MKVLLLTKYGPKSASSRQRFLQFLPRLAQAGIECTVAPLLNDAYLDHKFSTGHGRASERPRRLRRAHALSSRRACTISR
jgi:hypothetical protein